jgi:tetratricopeptide (TPR) repeat protein
VGTNAAAASKRHVLERYRHLREDHLRYMERCGLVRPLPDGGGFVFRSLISGLLRQVDGEMASGVPFRRVIRALMAAQAGQLTFDFRHDALPAKVLLLTRPEPPPLMAMMGAVEPARDNSAEEYFQAASMLDDGHAEHMADAMNAYRRSLEADPYLVPALINLANLHYSRDDAVRGQALYERAIGLEPTRSRRTSTWETSSRPRALQRGQACYREAMRLNRPMPRRTSIWR